MDENDIGREVVDAAIAVHRELGPGLLATVYAVVLLDELQQRG
jgi:GxxExxY protein